MHRSSYVICHRQAFLLVLCNGFSLHSMYGNEGQDGELLLVKNEEKIEIPINPTNANYL